MMRRREMQDIKNGKYIKKGKEINDEGKQNRNEK